MPSENMRWETLEALRNSGKGRISFDPHWSERGEDILSRCDDVISLSRSGGFTLDRLASEPLPSPTEPLPSSPKPLPFQEEAPPTQLSRNSTPEQCGGEGELCLLSRQAMETEGQIRLYQEERRERAQALVSERVELQGGVVSVLARSEAEQLKRVEELMELKRRRENQDLRDMMDRETRESLGRQEKLKEEQRHRMKVLNLRLREAELQRAKEAELCRQRQAEGRERHRRLNSLQEEVLQLNGQLNVSDGSAHNATATLTELRQRGNHICSHMSQLVRDAAQGDCPSSEDLAAAEACLQHMKVVVLAHQEELTNQLLRKKKEEEQRQEAELRQRAELLANQEAEKRKKEEAAKATPKTSGLRTDADSSTLKWFQDLQDSGAQCSRDFQNLSNNSDKQTRKLKLELSKMASIPVSQISSVSGSQLREVFSKMEALLGGRAVATTTGGKQVSASQHPEGRSYIRYKMAEKFVKQGEEEVSSHHEAAFPLAVVFSGIWELHPEVGDLLLFHLHQRCPYSVPHYPPKPRDTPPQEYYKLLGYRVNEDGVEGQDSFLKRMSGMIRLYAAMLTLRWPYGDPNKVSPHGLDHGWRWLAQMLNMEPLADVTATLLLDFLEVCGNALMKQYQSQFWKLLLLLQELYLPRVEAVTSAGQMGSVSRLKEFLQVSLRTRQISPPKGTLSSAFWRS